MKRSLFLLLSFALLFAVTVGSTSPNVTEKSYGYSLTIDLDDVQANPSTEIKENFSTPKLKGTLPSPTVGVVSTVFFVPDGAEVGRGFYSRVDINDRGPPTAYLT
jgi:hypothetical protein